VDPQRPKGLATCAPCKKPVWVPWRVAAADTPFSLRTADNRTLGAVRATSVYLREDGGVGSTQQIDLVV
jgi:hypothetical protein